MPDIVHLEVAYTQSFNLDRQTYWVLRTQPCMSGRILKWHIHNKPARCIAGRAVVPAQQKGKVAAVQQYQRAASVHLRTQSHGTEGAHIHTHKRIMSRTNTLHHMAHG